MSLVLISGKWSLLSEGSNDKTLIVVANKQTYTLTDWKIITGSDGATTIRGNLYNSKSKRNDNAVLYWSARLKPRPLDYETMSWEDMYELTPEQVAKSDKAGALKKGADVSQKITKEDVLNRDNYAPGYYRRS